MTLYCGACGSTTIRRTTRPPRTPINKIGDEWTTLYTYASRWTIHKLRARWPDYEFRHTCMSLAFYSDDRRYHIEARKK